MRSLFNACFLLAGLAAAHSAETAVRGVTSETYSRWTNALVMRGGDNRLVVVPAVGGRVLNYSFNSENIIYENHAMAGETLATMPRGFSPGGAQCDVGPELRGIPPHPNLWLGPWTGAAPRDFVIRVTSQPESALGVVMEKEFTMEPDTGEVGVVQRLRNTAGNDVSFCLWDRTLCVGGGFALLPVSRKSAFKARWSIRRGKAGEYRYDGTRPADARARLLGDVLVVQSRELPDARELKVGTDSDAGWIAYVRGRMLYVKYFPVHPGGNYSDGGNTMEFYCNERVAELEPLSPEVKLKPGAEYEFPEKWTLIGIGEEILTHEKARALVKKIPKSPFAR
jgi:hypothetical protein